MLRLISIVAIIVLVLALCSGPGGLLAELAHLFRRRD